MPMRDRSKSSLCNSNCGEIEFFLNYQQHKFGIFGSHFFPLISSLGLLQSLNCLVENAT